MCIILDTGVFDISLIQQLKKIFSESWFLGVTLVFQESPQTQTFVAIVL